MVLKSEKKTYEQATAEIVLFDNTDAVRTSGGWYCSQNFDGPGHNTCQSVSAAAQQ